MNRIRKKSKNFTSISNDILRNENISFKAKGLFCYMYSMDEDWNFTIKSIATQQKDGETSIISALNELKEHGYITYEKHQNGSGTYHLDDSPKLENPNVENPNLGKPQRIKNKKLVKNKKLKEENKKENSFPQNLNIEAFELWCDYKGKSYSDQGKKLSINKLIKYPKEVQMQMVENSIMNSYKGLFEVKPNSAAANNTFAIANKTYDENEEF